MTVPPVLGQYQLVRKIAAGGMAEVFLARQRGPAGFQRDVVVKRLFHHLADNPRQLRMFHDEAKILAVFSHPNIAQVYELGHDQDQWFIAMEHVQGPDLAEVCRRAARARLWLPLEVSVGLVRQVAAGLAHAHERRDQAGRPLRLVHRDVSPANVLVTFDGVVKLLDFGVARSDVRRDTDAGRIKGTLAYMAPEQVRGKPVDRRADIFSLGVILWELTTGSRLYRGNDLQIMTSIVERDAPRPSTRVPAYPAELERIAMSMLARDPTQRTADMATLGVELESFGLTLGLPTGPTGIARYLRALMPRENVYEADGIVEPPRLVIVEDGAELASTETDNLPRDTHPITLPTDFPTLPGPTPGPAPLDGSGQWGAIPERRGERSGVDVRPEGPSAPGAAGMLELDFELDDEGGDAEGAYVRKLSRRLAAGETDDPERRKG